MANAIVSRLGQVNQAGDPLALFLKQFGGEVLVAFNRDTMFLDKFMTRRIANGKSAQFPVTGLASAYYHVPGDEILGGRIPANERVINLEGMLISPVFIPNIDEAMNHYDVRSIYATDLGQALSKQMDQNIGRVAVMAARNATPNITGMPAGTTVNNAAFANDGTVLYNGVFDAGVTLDTKDIPQEGRNAFLTPVGYALVLRSEKPIDRRFTNGNNGDEATGVFHLINNIGVQKTNNFPTSNDIANALQPASRQHDFSVTKGIVAHKSAVGTLLLQDMAMEGQYDMRRQGHLILGKYIAGHDQLRPESAVELRTADPAG